MPVQHPAPSAPLIHIVTLECKDATHAERCIAALSQYGKPDADAYKCVSYEFGVKVGAPDTVYLVERWNRWDDLDALLRDKVVPALPLYNALLKHPFDPAKHTVRIDLCDLPLEADRRGDSQ